MRIVGYKEIAATLRRNFGVELSVRTLYRYADPTYAGARGVTPLPVENGIGGQHMIESEQLEKWVKDNVKRVYSAT